MTQKEQKRLIVILSVVCAMLLVIAGFAFIFTEEEKPFSPPPFEATAVKGVPTVPKHLGWFEIYKDGMSFRSNICGEIRIRDGKAKIYFTNFEENTLWLKVRIQNQEGKILAESGLLRPGEYLEEISFERIPNHLEPITLHIMSYEPGTYYSGGVARLNTEAKLED